jgi:hypothetical protein
MGLVMLGLLCIAGSLGCEGPRKEAPLDNATLNAGLDPNYRPAAQSRATQWKSVVYAHRTGGTGAGSLRARTSDLIHLSAPRRVAIRAVFRYVPETETWARLALDPLPSMTLKVALPRQVYSAESDPVLLTIPQPVGLFWALWEEDGHRLATAIYAGPMLCEDVMLGPAPPGRVAMCVPFADRAEARFVPDPSRL